MAQEHLPYGLYERVVTNRLRTELERATENAAAQLSKLDADEAHILLAQYIGDAVQAALRALPRTKRLENQVHLANRILETVHGVIPAAVDSEDHVQHEILQAVLQPNQEPPPRPGIPLSQSELLVNARDEYRIGHELIQEIESADRIDLICSFVKWGGVRLMRDALSKHLKRGRAMRVLTTTYLGSTDQKALDFLLDLGAEIRVSYDTRRTRLHAKAWLLHRETGYSTAYIGSSNLSATAQTDGLEWNVRVSQVDAARIVQKFEATFNNYWGDGEFVPYDGSEEQRKNFARAISKERDGPDRELPITYFDIRPYPFQQEILDRLEVERTVRGRSRNLVVAATGTGKTVVAALDYKRLKKRKEVESLLFVAHRQEILRQSRRTFRHVLRDGSFGELLVAGLKPEEGHHVFASVQSLAQIELSDLDPASFDMVIVDEFHHAAAPTYSRLLNHLKPRQLLGLTATPERADGRSVKHWFDDHVASELRIWDAIERGLLVPFHYFGVHDNTDLTQLAWRQGKYDVSELENLYTGDVLRANMVLGALEESVRSVAEVRALGFCVSKAHAHFMADAFNRAGVPSLALTADTPSAERQGAIAQLQSRKLNVIFVVDLFNEGVDIPEVDTVLFLRPTESATVFMQQLGRGLRLFEDKECLTVLDFVGNARKEYRFDKRFGTLLGMGRGRVRKQVEQGFPLLPSGCSIKLDRQSREIVLENLRRTVGADKRSLVSELRRLGPDMPLATFLEEVGLELEDLYRGGRFMTDLRDAAGGTSQGAGPKQDSLGKALGRILHMDDPDWLIASRRFAQGHSWEGYSPRGRAMLLVSLLGAEAYRDLDAAEALLRQHPAICTELAELLELLLERVDHVPREFDHLPDVPLKLHCRYSRDEIMASFDFTKKGVLYQPREGVVFDPESGANLLFVTVNKSEKDYSPSTMYEDYALTPTEFHWQSQATTRPETEKGKRHWQHRELGITPLLFVREARKTEYGATAPYFFLGPVEYVKHHGERPMNVTWRLQQAIPADWMRRLRVA
ncbi:MAG: DUF3427 domain-containing protein [Rhodothermales bacterium]|nr:DUF3427 domain-containing protein [Rhodothermales bacterium]MBO6778670.1 DUF3427 domain-containing protein [Rhodothermales bacterium]